MSANQVSERHSGADLTREADPRLGPVLDLAESCDYEAPHTQHVTRLALELFDGLAALHGLDAEARYWLTCAALLHDIGWADPSQPHHKAALRLILDSPLLPWDRRLRLLVGSVARYHRRSLPASSHGHFAELGEADRRAVRTLAAILRVADGLDRTHRGLVRGLDCGVDKDRIIVSGQVGGAADAERAKALEKSDLLEEVFGRPVEIVWRSAPPR